MNNDLRTSPMELNSQQIPTNFWEVFLNSDQLRGCDNLEKLLIGCEVIASMDDIDELLAA